MRERNGAGAGDSKIAGPLSRNVIDCGDILDIVQETPAPQAEIQNTRRARVDAARQHIAALAELFSACFVADKWETHRPLKVGIKADLIATGLLTSSECRRALGLYVGRIVYQKAIVAGGPRVDLDGNMAGDATQDQIEHALAAVARIEAKAIAKAEAVRKQKAARKAAKEMAAEQQPASRTPPPPPRSPSHSTAPGRDGIAALRRAAIARRGPP
jgi:sRNA-binding protein